MPFTHRFQSALLQWTDSMTALPEDDKEVRLLKRIWWICLTFAVPFSIILILLSWWRGHTLLVYLFAIFTLYWLGSMWLFQHIRQSIDLFGLSSQSFLIIFSIGMCILCGGILTSGGFLFLGLVGPVYALAFPHKARAIWLLMIYLVAIIVISMFQDRHQPFIVLSASDNLIFFITSFVMTTLFWFAALYFFAEERTQSLQMLEKEQKRTHRLLLNILPKNLVEKLKDNPQWQAETHESVTILFADIVDFTPMVEKTEPEALVSLLHEAFSHLDQLTSKYQLEKIKTIGDCYMAVAGIPVKLPNHAEAAVAMAREIHTFGHRHNLQFRIGIHSGRVIAGVIGTKKFSYDLWGKTVNQASRLQTNAPPGEILVSTAVKEQLPVDECKYHGCLHLKGIGLTDTWLVESKRLPNAIPLQKGLILPE